MCKGWMIAGMVLLSGAAFAQVDARVVLDPGDMPFYRQAVYTIVVEAPAETEVQLPDLRPLFETEKLMTEDSPVADYKKEPLDDGRVRITETYLLDPIFVKDYFFPPLDIALDESDTLRIPSPVLRVREPTPEEEAAVSQFDATILGGPKDVPPPLTSRWGFWVAVVLAALAVAGALAYWLITHRRIAEVAPLKEPWIQALERLAMLEERNLIGEGKYDIFYVDLSGILRYYIEGRYTVHAPERTTPEFLEEASGLHLFTPEQEAFLARVLRQSDRVKFAKYEPGTLEMRENLAEVRDFVEATIPAPEPEARAAA
jgi:hypothetical protein